MTGRLRLGLAVAAVAWIGAVAAAQTTGDSADPMSRPRFMVFLFEAESGTLSQQAEFLLYNSILTAAAAANPAVVVLESPDPDVPPSQVGKESLAQSINADSWLHVIASGGLANLTLEVETFDIFRRETFGKQVIRPGFVVDYRVLTAGLWDGIVATLRDNYRRVVDRTELRIAALPGTRIGGLSGSTPAVGESGELVVSVPSSSTVSLQADLRGYYQERRTAFVGIDPLAVSFRQVEKPRYGVDLSLSSLQFPGSRFWYYPVPAEIFVRAGFTTQAIGFYPIDNTDRLIRAGSTLSFFELDGGIYLTRPEQLFRLYAAAGLYLRFVHPSLAEMALETDGAPVALTLSLGGEYSTSRKLRFFAEYQPAYVLADDPQRYIDVSFVANRYPGGDVPGYIAFDWGVLDYRNVYIGARWDF
jgi:hypothetical protein